MFVLGERDRNGHLLQVASGFEELGSRESFGGVEVAAGAGHAVLALFEEGVGAVAVSEVVVLPGLAGRGGAGGDRVAVNEDLDGAYVAGEVPGVLVSLGQGVGADLCVVLVDSGERWPSQACSSNRAMGSLVL